MTGKRHDHLLRDIDGYIEVLSAAPNFGVSDFFIESTYKDTTGRVLRCYLITRKGCDMVANKMTGEKGVLFTATYVSKFDEMEKQLYGGLDINQLSPQLQFMIQLEQRTTGVEQEVSALKQVVDNEVWITESQRNRIREAVNLRVGQLMKNGYRNAHFQGIYSSLKTHFGVSKYDKIPRKDFETAMDIIRGWYPKRREDD
ncbi:antirepressor [Paenibacillus dendritiformis]|nr:antirepressor [Paenibacillus dendritiformis]